LRNYEQQLLAASCPSVHPHGTTLAPTGWILMKLDIGASVDNLLRKLKIHSNPSRITVFYMKTFSHL
jgi:hypothetical protein